MFTYLQNRIATEGGNPGPIPRSNEAPAEWDGQFWDQAKLDAALAAQMAKDPNNKIAGDELWMQALNPLSGITMNNAARPGYWDYRENGDFWVDATNQDYIDKLGRGYSLVQGAEGDPNTYIQYANLNSADGGFENPTGTKRDRVAPIYKLNPDGTATPHSANTNYRGSEWVRNGQDVATGVAMMVAAYFGGSWLAAYQAGAVAAPVAGSAATEAGAAAVQSSATKASLYGAQGYGATTAAEAGFAGLGATTAGGSAGLTAAEVAAIEGGGGFAAGGGATGAPGGGGGYGGDGYGDTWTGGEGGGDVGGGNVDTSGTNMFEGGQTPQNYSAGDTWTSAGTTGSDNGQWVNGFQNKDIVSGVAQVGSAYMQNQATNRAINAQTNAANSSNALQLAQYNQTRADNAPWRAAGENALGKLTALLNDGSLTSRFAGTNVQNEPGYAFGMREGMKAIDNSASARGGIGGAALKAGTRYAQDYAGTKYNDAFNRNDVETKRIYNSFSTAAGLGQQANALVGASGQNYANQVGNTTNSLGNAQGAAAMNQGNIYGNLLNEGVAFGNRNNWWQTRSGG